MNSKLKISNERLEELNKKGDINLLYNTIIENSNITIDDIKNNLGKWINQLTEKQRFCIVNHYIYGLSIYKIRYSVGEYSFVDIERSIKSGTNKLIKLANELNK